MSSCSALALNIVFSASVAKGFDGVFSGCVAISKMDRANWAFSSLGINTFAYFSCKLLERRILSPRPGELHPGRPVSVIMSVALPALATFISVLLGSSAATASATSLEFCEIEPSWIVGEYATQYVFGALGGYLQARVFS